MKELEQHVEEMYNILKEESEVWQYSKGYAKYKNDQLKFRRTTLLNKIEELNERN